MVEPGSHGRMGGKQIGCPGRCASGLEITLVFILPTEGTLDQGQGTMAFVEMAQGRLPAQLFQETPATDSKHHFLLQTLFRIAGIKFTGNPPVTGFIAGVVAVEEQKFAAPYLSLSLIHI